MTISSIKIVVPYPVQEVWELVTSLYHYKWRSDIEKIVILNDRQFVEYTKDNYATTFTVTCMEPYRRWAFDLENDTIKGHWTGTFKKLGEQTELIFVEEVTAKKFFIKPFLKGYLKKQQAQYMADLKKALAAEK